MHGGSCADCAEVRDHAEIINAVVQNNCESLLPMESINTQSLRNYVTIWWWLKNFHLPLKYH